MTTETVSNTTITTRAAFTKVLHPADEHMGNHFVPVFVEVKYSNDGRLSMTGVVGPRSNGDCAGSCGQINMGMKVDELRLAPGWTGGQLQRLFEVWDRWHLNDMRAGCEHQRETWNPSEKLEVVSYGLTTEAYRLRERALAKAAQAGLDGNAAQLSDTERALASMDDWYKDRHEPPDADSPLSGCYEVKKRETKSAGWVIANEHPRGILIKPCDVCGYRYGTKWLREEVPADVLDFLRSLPVTDKRPAWV
jgi:hypothetical protein